MIGGLDEEFETKRTFSGSKVSRIRKMGHFKEVQMGSEKRSAQDHLTTNMVYKEEKGQYKGCHS